MYPLLKTDPENNGIEIYRDRPSEEWPQDSEGHVIMDTSAHYADHLSVPTPSTKEILPTLSETNVEGTDFGGLLPTNYSISVNGFNLIFGSGLIIGTNMDDIIKVDNLTTKNQIFGRDGNDYIKGGANFDLIFGGRGDDRIQSDSDRADALGDDEVFGEDGDDSINGQAGDDILNGGNGDDELLGDGGDDMLIAGNGNDHLYGGIGDDVLQGGTGSDYFNCGPGLDVVIDYNPNQNDLVTVDCEMGVTTNEIPDIPGQGVDKSTQKYKSGYDCGYSELGYGVAGKCP